MIMSSGSSNELIQIADAVAKEKLIDPKLVIEAMEESLAKAAKSKYGQEYDIRADIDSKSGTVSMARWRKVVESVENHFTEINEVDARKINPEVTLEGFVEEQLPPMDFGRIAAQAAKQIDIKTVCRDPGSRAKIGVLSHDNSIDPVGACVGMRGSRVQAVVNELQGEKIDIIPWNEDAPTFLVNALQPAEVSKVVLDEDAKRIEVVVPTDQLSLAIGRRGQNVRLASQLTEYDIDILTEEDESQRRQEEFSERSNLFMEHLDVDEMVAQLLVSEGFSTMEEVAYVDSGEISSIDGFDKETTTELQERAKDYLENLNKQSLDFVKSNGIEDDLLNFEGLNPQMLEVLIKDGIKSLKDFATCADWELAGGYTTVDGKRVRDEGLLEHFDLSLSDAQQLIMKAREMLGWVTKEESDEIIKSLDK